MSNNFMQVIEGSERCLNGHPIVQKVYDGSPWLCADVSCPFSVNNVQPKPPTDTELDRQIWEKILFPYRDGILKGDITLEKNNANAVAQIKQLIARGRLDELQTAIARKTHFDGLTDEGRIAELEASLKEGSEG